MKRHTIRIPQLKKCNCHFNGRGFSKIYLHCNIIILFFLPKLMGFFFFFFFVFFGWSFFLSLLSHPPHYVTFCVRRGRKKEGEKGKKRICCSICFRWKEVYFSSHFHVVFLVFFFFLKIFFSFFPDIFFINGGLPPPFPFLSQTEVSPPLPLSPPSPLLPSHSFFSQSKYGVEMLLPNTLKIT